MCTTVQLWVGKGEGSFVRACVRVGVDEKKKCSNISARRSKFQLERQTFQLDFVKRIGAASNISA